MNAREESYYNMEFQVKKFMDDTTEKWNTIPAIVTQKNELDETLQAIGEKLKETKEYTKPITLTKNETKALAALKASILAGAVAAHAARTGDHELTTVADLTKNGLYRLSDQTFRSPIDTLISVAMSQLESLADQGVTEAQITELGTTLDDFSEMVGDPRRIAIRESLKKKAISELIKDAKTLLEEQMDKSMLRYKLIDPIFHEGYERARMIVG